MIQLCIHLSYDVVSQIKQVSYFLTDSSDILELTLYKFFITL